MFVRQDLTKFQDVPVKTILKGNAMPRQLISGMKNEFNKLIELLDQNDNASTHVWNLIKQLSTNQVLKREVIYFSKDGVKEQDKIIWKKYFEEGSTFKQIYTYKIILEIMEAGLASCNIEKIQFVQTHNR